MKGLSRREALIQQGLGTAGLFLYPRAGNSAAELGDEDLAVLAERIRKTPHAEVFGLAAKAIRSGTGWRTLLGAVFVAGIQDIRPRPVGSKLHAVMVVESAFQLAETSPGKGPWLAALWVLDDFKRSQERDRQEDDWELPPRPEVSFASEKEARREFEAAMEAWDAERADRAIVGLYPHHGHESLFEILWPFAGRCYVNFGHKIIYAVQIERALRRIGCYAEPALRSLVNALLYADPRRATEAFERSAELAPSLPKGWRQGREDAGQSLTLLLGLRGRTSAEAQNAVAEAFRDGLGPATVWDGLRLYASELFLRRAASATQRHLPVHPVTEINAFSHASRETRGEATQRLLILQAAGWLPLLERAIRDGFGPPRQTPGIDALGGTIEGALRLDEVFEARSPEQARVCLDHSPKTPAMYLSRLRSFLFRKAWQNHQYKYTAAIQEESRLVHPRWASRVLAPAVNYLPSGAEPGTDVFQRSLDTLGKAGIA